ncbi:uncharacterized protein F5Z01DRAFT_169180 [Emericellopsis atlantica]|uniref:Uncharacterized protein n=1 Tax=Emericellopsis atlantica TaxID=2614577 RepID=A0A9P8CPP0_9HYPO|nr:uncharacterized protein F5Z01DRAFT_169180 [Emericellopsis atlantica]KAG9252946.1 hypothetical protein F5Z01DRAFT_169180 [Emericellopsis atlantica]
MKALGLFQFVRFSLQARSVSLTAQARDMGLSAGLRCRGTIVEIGAQAQGAKWRISLNPHSKLSKDAGFKVSRSSARTALVNKRYHVVLAGVTMRD